MFQQDNVSFYNTHIQLKLFFVVKNKQTIKYFRIFEIVFFFYFCHMTKKAEVLVKKLRSI